MNKEEIIKIKEFDKNQLSKLISDLRDINTYTSFKNGSFIYDLGKYQGSLLVNHIDELEQRIDNINKLLIKERDYHIEGSLEYKIIDEIIGKINKLNKED